jgi:hypothetical protein
MSVTPNVRNCCDLALTKCLKILPCSHFCLQQRICATCTDTSVSYEAVNGGKGGLPSPYDGAKLSFTGSTRCCGTVKVGDTLTIDRAGGVAANQETWTILKIEAGKITLKFTSGTMVGTAATTASRLVLNGINGHLCSVFYDSDVGAAYSPCIVCPEARFDIARSTSSGTCSATTCNSCTC